MKYDNIIAGDFPMVKDKVVLGGNQNLKMGCVLGRKSVSAGAKGKYYFALTSFTGADSSTLSVTIGEKTYSIDCDSASTVDGMLEALAAEVNADSTCEFTATADKTNDRFYLEAKNVGTWAASVTITMSKTTMTLTIGSKTQATAAADASNGEYYAVNSSLSDGTQIPRAVLLEDVTVAEGSTAIASAAFTGVFNKDKLSFGSTDTWATHFNDMRDRCMFVKDVVPSIHNG